jgi:predicted RNA-binding Zn ribbon-like protein
MARSDDRFRFGLGHPALEFTATLAGRFEHRRERLQQPADLDRWLRQAGLAVSPDSSQEVLAEARELREATYGLLRAARGGRSAQRENIRLVNAWAARPLPAPQIGPNLQAEITGSDPARAALTSLARLTAELVTGPDLARVQDCARPGCSLMFIDRSPPGQRRWCSMERCGNRAKIASYRQRLAAPAPQ